MDFWQKQSLEQPLFEDLLWSKPENKKHAGKLLIIGGQKENFSHVSKAYHHATKSGAGQIKVLMPSSLQKLAGFLPDTHFAPSNQSGSFAADSLSEILDMSSWADAVLLAGDLGKNSETHIVLDKFIGQKKSLICLSSDSFDSFSLNTANREKCLIVCDLNGLQTFCKNNHFEQPFTSSMGALKFANTIRDFSKKFSAYLMCYFDNKIWVAVDGKVSSTPTDNSDLVVITSTATVWLMQNPSKPFESLTTACL